MTYRAQHHTEIEWLGHESVTGSDLCAQCASMGFRNYDELAFNLAQSQLTKGDHRVPYYKTSSLHAVSNFRVCWLCRLLFRFSTHILSEELFARWQEDNVQIDFSWYPSIWALQLLVEDAREASDITFVIRPAPYYENRLHLSCFSRQATISRDIDEHASSFSGRTVDAEKVKSWISVCQLQHESCSKYAPISASSDFRLELIDVKTRQIVTVTRGCQYVALSFVWGHNPLEKIVPGAHGNATAGDIVRMSRRDRKVPDTIPATFEDAISITRCLGQRYIWIDCFCLEQSDPKTKQVAIENMDAIYSNAFLTVCVLDGDSVFSGIPGVRNPHYGKKVAVVETKDSRYVVTYMEYLQTLLSGSKWSTRAWCFQEGAMPTRCLFFSAEGYFLICREEIFHDIQVLDTSEARSTSHFNKFFDFGLPFGIDLVKDCWSFRTYSRITTAYSRRTMSFQSDALNAISGGLNMITRSTGMEFAYAIPKQDIANGLLWFHPRPATLNHAYAKFIELYDSRNHQREGFPSWSWIGWQAPAKYVYWLSSAEKTILGQVNDENDRLYSLTDDKNGYQYQDIIRLSSCASASISASTFSRPILTLVTKTVSLKVTCVSEPNLFLDEPLERHRAKSGDHWLIRDIHEAPITVQDIEAFHGDTLVFFYYDAKAKESFHSINVHCCVSDRLLAKRTDTLEFVLLQHWENAATEDQLEHFRNEPAAHDISGFTERVWVMAVARNDDGVRERIAITWIPSPQWFEADPKDSTIHIV